MANAQKLLDLTGDVPVGLYETPVPKVRLGPADLVFANPCINMCLRLQTIYERVSRC